MVRKVVHRRHKQSVRARWVEVGGRMVDGQPENRCFRTATDRSIIFFIRRDPARFYTRSTPFRLTPVWPTL